MLNHTSGIVGYTEIPTFGVTVRNPYAPAKFVDEFFAKLDLLFEPGTKFSCSNSGYFLLGVILEKVTGQPRMVTGLKPRRAIRAPSSSATRRATF